MSKKVKNYDKVFKAKVALEAYKGEKSMLEIAKGAVLNNLPVYRLLFHFIMH